LLRDIIDLEATYGKDMDENAAEEPSGRRRPTAVEEPEAGEERVSWMMKRPFRLRPMELEAEAQEVLETPGSNCRRVRETFQCPVQTARIEPVAAGRGTAQ
jgi:hypothetical protein